MQKDSSVSLHHRNLRILASEIFKVVKDISPETMKEVFSFLFPKQYQFKKSTLFIVDVIIVLTMVKIHLLSWGRKYENWLPLK